MKPILAIVALILLAACEPAPAPEPIVRTVEVKVPVTTYRKPPASLKREPICKIPERHENCFKMFNFTSVTDKNATVALTGENEDLFKAYVIDRETRLDIWEKSGF